MSKSSARKWWATVSIARKLHFIVIVMTIMIIVELLSLWLSLSSLSAVRAYVNGEGLWTKAQQAATSHLIQYGFTHNQADYQKFLTSLNVTLGDKIARIELSKPKPDYARLTQGFLEGRNSPLDIDNMIKLYQRFHKISYIEKSISIWEEADSKIKQLQRLGLKLNKILLSKNATKNEVDKILIEIQIVNEALNKLETDFSYTLGEASRWVDHAIFKTLLTITLTVEMLVLIFTALFIQHISIGIEKINIAAKKVSTGDFDAKIQENSSDELGRLASTFNSMIESLKINTRKRVESESLFKTAFENTPIGFALLNLTGQFLKVNKSLCLFTGYSAIELMEKTFNDITHPDDKDIGSNALANTILMRISTFTVEKRYIHKGGNIVWGRVNCTIQRGLDGEPLYLISQVEDITEQKKSAIQINEQAALLDKAQDAILVKDMKQKIIYWNKSAERLYGWEAAEVINKKTSILYAKNTSLLDAAMGILQSKGEWSGELKHVTKYGNEIIVQSRWTLIFDNSGMPKSIFIVNTDITEKKALEKQFYRGQRLESIGTMTTGIAHDLNNIFTPIMISAHLLQMDLPETKRNQILNNLVDTSQRGADFIKQLLIFGMGGDGINTNVKLDQIITQITTMIKETFPKTITFEINLPDSLWSVLGCSTKLYQVILNLCVNSRDAMPDGGIIKIVAENIILDENYIRSNLEAKMGNYVCISVSDTGAGIPSEIIHKIFDPFFTTKEVGQSSGLGLTIIMAIVKKHGGFVIVDSTLGSGSQFKIFIPAINTVQVEDIEIQGVSLLTGNGELIMIVDDERAIVESARTILEGFNYKVITATNGLEGLEKYKSSKEEIKVIITDIDMPVIDGITFIKALFEIDSNIIVIASSGLPLSISKIDASDLDITSFLQKPYTPENLLNKINESLMPGRRVARERSRVNGKIPENH